MLLYATLPVIFFIHYFMGQEVRKGLAEQYLELRQLQCYCKCMSLLWDECSVWPIHMDAGWHGLRAQLQLSAGELARAQALARSSQVSGIPSNVADSPQNHYPENNTLVDEALQVHGITSSIFLLARKRDLLAQAQEESQRIFQMGEGLKNGKG